MKENRMSKKHISKLTHVCLVVRDLEKAIEHLSSLGMGPFEQSHAAIPTKEKLFRDKPANYSVKASTGKMGDLTLEVIQPVQGESPHTEFLDSKGEGIAH